MHANFLSSNLRYIVPGVSTESRSLSSEMARVEGEGLGSRKLSVAETLKQATAALETHRAWMKRRVSTSIAPFDRNTGPGSGRENTSIGEESYSRTTANVGWALGSEKGVKQQGDNEVEGAGPPTISAGVPAPPLSTRAWQQGAQGYEIESESASSNNSPPSQANHDLLESPNTPFPEHRQDSPDTAGTPVDHLGTAGSNKLHFTFPSSSSQTKQSNFKIKKRQRMGKFSVVPMGESLTEVDEEASEDILLSPSRAKSPEVFIGESFQSKVSPILPASTLVAWGSLSSLDNYIESLETTDKNTIDKKSTHQESAKLLTSSTPLGSLANGTKKDTCDPEMTIPRSETLSSPQQPLASPDPVHSSTTDHHITHPMPSPTTTKAQDSSADHSMHMPSPSKDESGESSFESSSNAEQFEALKAASSATLIPVSQAPRAQRSSFSHHKQSKLGAAEANTKIYKAQFKNRPNVQVNEQLTRYGDRLNQNSSRNSSSMNIPDSVLQNVLPKQIEQARKSGLTMLHVTQESEHVATLHVQGQQQSTPAEKSEYKNQQLSLADSQPTSPQTSLKTSLPTTTELQLVDQAQQSHGSKTNVHVLARSKSFPTKEAGVRSQKRDDTSESLKVEELLQVQEETSTGETPGGPLFPSHSTPRFKSRALEVLNLPPLKTMIDENEIVRSLPPLKIQSPLIPHLKAFSSLSRKHEYSPPPYAIHRLAGGKALAPPCPAYGTQQPQEKDILRVISSHRGSLSPDNIDSLLTVEATSFVSRKTSSEETAERSTLRDTTTNDLKLLPSSSSLPQNRVSEGGGRQLGGMEKAIDSSSMLARRSSHTFAAALRGGGGGGHSQGHRTTIAEGGGGGHSQQDRTTIEDVETTDSFQVHTTLVSSGNGKVQTGRKGSGAGDHRVSELRDTADWSSQGSPIDNVDVSSSSHFHHQQATPPGPGPLHMAAKSGNLRRLQALIKQGHDVDMPEQEGRTPLMYCIHSRGVHLSCADALIQEGANLNKQSSDGSTAMHLAASVGALALIELLLLNGANPDIRDFEGRLPLHWATIQHNPKTITLLLQHSNFDLNVTDDAGMTPLMWAAYHNNVSITTFLLREGADHEEKDIDGYTAMHWAIHRSGTECLRLLLKPDMTYFKDHRGRTVIHLAAKEGAMAASEIIIKMRPDAIFDTDKLGHTPLHYAAACSRVDVCALLLDFGADATQRDSEGLSPLDYARRKKLDYVVALLTCHGTALADFARASRSTSISSFLNRTISFSQLNIQDREDEVQEGGEREDRETSLPRPLSPNASTSDNASLSKALSYSNLSKSLTNINTVVSASPHSKLLEEDSQLSMSSSHLYQPTDDDDSVSLTEHQGQLQRKKQKQGAAGADDSKMETAKGGYLGRFTNDRQDPIKHYYFWLKQSEGSIYWSRLRENANRNSQRAVVLEVHEGPSQAVKKNPSYSPGDLHKYVFWVLTGGGVLDLFAYNEDAYGMWLNNISNIANSNAKKGIDNLNLKNQSRTQTRPASSLSTKYSRATVAPSNNLTNEEGSSTTLSIGNSEFSIDAGDTNFSRGMASAKVNTSTAWASGSRASGDRGKENESKSVDGSGRHHPSFLSRSFSAPPEEQLQPLKMSTPLSLSAHTSHYQQQFKHQPNTTGAAKAKSGNCQAYTPQDVTDNDVI